MQKTNNKDRLSYQLQNKENNNVNEEELNEIFNFFNNSLYFENLEPQVLSDLKIHQIICKNLNLITQCLSDFSNLLAFLLNSGK